ncbi:MAG: GreA/GreB family elongation factor [Nocardioidaceae bacterium]
MTQPSDASVIWLTERAFEALTTQLAQMKDDTRSDVVAKIAAARDEGDLKENGGYHAAREEQGKLESRSGSSRRCSVTQTGPRPRTMAWSSRDDRHHPVRRRLRLEMFLLGAGRWRSSRTAPRCTPPVPLGAAILGSTKGDTVTYEAPNGKELKVEIVDAVPSGTDAPVESARPHATGRAWRIRTPHIGRVGASARLRGYSDTW